MPALSDEIKYARKFIKELNVLSFDLSQFAFPIAMAPIAVRRRFIDLVYILVQTWAERYHEGKWENDEELAFLIDVKRVSETIPAYYKKR